MNRIDRRSSTVPDGSVKDGRTPKQLPSLSPLLPSLSPDNDMYLHPKEGTICIRFDHQDTAPKIHGMYRFAMKQVTDSKTKGKQVTDTKKTFACTIYIYSFP